MPKVGCQLWSLQATSTQGCRTLLRAHSPAKGEERLTWILLFHRDQASNEVRCELSCPVKINDDGQIDAWAERIILAPIPFGGDNVEVRSDVPKTPQIEVKIKRKTKRA